MNAPARGNWRPGDEPPPGWRRDPEDSRFIREFTGEVEPGATAQIMMRHQRPFIWEGIAPTRPHASSELETKGSPAVEGAADALEACALTELDSIADAARGRNWMSLSAWFLCDEQGAPAMNWEGRPGGPVFHVGAPGCVVLIRNRGTRAHSYAIRLQGIEQVGL